MAVPSGAASPPWDKLSANHTALRDRACMDCGQVKPKEDFSVHSHPYAKDGYMALPRCRDCNSVEKYRIMISHKYGLTPDDVQRMSDEQGGKCLLCDSLAEEKGGKRLVIDHCHTSGKVRGLLCHTCNKSLGYFQENMEWLDRVKAYLTLHS